MARFVHVAITVAATTAAGAFLVWLRIETGSIWVPVAVHAGVNMTLAAFARLATRTKVTPVPALEITA
jgi:membrane protease YdiL (CAAX protease family)